MSAIQELEMITIEKGSGERVCAKLDTIKTRVQGTLIDGSEFWATKDSDPRNPGHPEYFTTPVGVGKLIAGFDEGVIGMQKGEKRQIRIPWIKGYGASGMQPIIPPKADLIFMVTLVDFLN